jgi:hypothetical protein
MLLLALIPASRAAAADSVGVHWVLEQPAPGKGDVTRAWLTIAPTVRRPSVLTLIKPTDGAAWFAPRDGSCTPVDSSHDSVKIDGDGPAVLQVCAIFWSGGLVTLLAELSDAGTTTSWNTTLFRSDVLDVDKPPPETRYGAALVAVGATLLGFLIQHFLSVRQDTIAAGRKYRDDSRDVLRQFVEKVNLELTAHELALASFDASSPESVAPVLTLAGASLMAKPTTIAFLDAIGQKEYAERVKAYYQSAAEFNAQLQGLAGATASQKGALDGATRTKVDTEVQRLKTDALGRAAALRKSLTEL